MTFLIFVLVNSALVAFDFAVTLALYLLGDFYVVTARLCGAGAAVAAMLILIRIWPGRNRSRALPVIVSVITGTVNCGLFVLLYLREPMLNWPLLFGLTSVAALLFGAAGYRRALIRST